MESQRDGGGDVEFMILMSGMMMLVGIGFAGGSAWLCLRRRRGRLLFTTLLFVGFFRCVAGSRRCHFQIKCGFCDLFLTLIVNRICCLDSVWDFGEFSVSHLDGRVGLSVVGYILSQYYYYGVSLPNVWHSPREQGPHFPRRAMLLIIYKLSLSVTAAVLTTDFHTNISYT